MKTRSLKKLITICAAAWTAQAAVAENGPQDRWEPRYPASECSLHSEQQAEESAAGVGRLPWNTTPPALLGPASAENSHDAQGQADPLVPPDQPRVIGPLPLGGDRILRAAWPLARERAASSECRALFRSLEAEPVEVLELAIYSGPYRSEVSICQRRRASAFTLVGGGRTILCPSFAKLSPRAAAEVLIHEALHSAGQPEWPMDPRAPKSAQIHRRVRQHCGGDAPNSPSATRQKPSSPGTPSPSRAPALRRR